MYNPKVRIENVLVFLDQDMVFKINPHKKCYTTACPNFK